MVNTLPFLMAMPAHILMGLAFLAFFLARAIPGLRDIKPMPIFAGILGLAALLEFVQSGSESLFFGMVQVDSFSRNYNLIFYIATLVTLLLINQSKDIDRDRDWENMGLMVCLVMGMMYMSSSSHLIMAVIAIELVSLPSYLLVAMNRNGSASKEASLKYILFGSFATAVMLYGMSLIYGLTGSLHFEGIWKGLSAPSVQGTPIYYLALVMSLSGMIFKVAAVPFHFWCPDAYQAAPTPVTAFLSTAPKVAGLALMMRFFASNSGAAHPEAIQLISGIAMVTMTLGNFAALRQSDVKRLLAYSSISHAGFLLMGIAVMNAEGRQAVFFYVPIYLLMNLGAFMTVIYLASDNNYQVDSFKGLMKKFPLLVTAFAICVFSLAGVPPFAGFIGKFYLFKAVLGQGLFGLAIVAGVNSVVSLYYYVNLLKVMIIDDGAMKSPVVENGTLAAGFVAVVAVPLVLLGVYWVPLLTWARLVQNIG